MEMHEVKHTLVQIERLKEERDGYKKEAKRCQDDIDSLLAQMTRRIVFPQQDDLPGLVETLATGRRE